MKILALGGSSSSQSINRQFAEYVSSLLSSQVTVYDLSTKTLPIFSEDEEKLYIPDEAQEFIKLIRARDLIVLSLAEHNGSYTAAFKNLYDWASRIDYNVWGGRKMILLSTSSGRRGGKTVLEQAKATFPRMGAEIMCSYSLPSFHEKFSGGRLIDTQADVELKTMLSMAGK